MPIVTTAINRPAFQVQLDFTDEFRGTVPRFFGNDSSHGLLGDGLVVVKVVVLNGTFQSGKTALAAHFSKPCFT